MTTVNNPFLEVKNHITKTAARLNLSENVTNKLLTADNILNEKLKVKPKRDC